LPKLTFGSCLASHIVAITVAKSKTFYLHFDLVVAESERFATALKGGFKEATENAIQLEDEDPALFGFFVKYLYRGGSILPGLEHYSEYVTLARLYAMGERLIAPIFQARCLSRFDERFGGLNFIISDECMCDLFEIACVQITERVTEDHLQSLIFWEGSRRATRLQKYSVFRQLCRDIPEVDQHIALWVGKNRPDRPPSPSERPGFEPESEEILKRTV
jgi:hypothetical protein